MSLVAAKVCFLLLAVSAAAAQSPRAAMEKALARQQAAIGKQRAAVQTQVRKAVPAPAAFFTVPWRDDAEMPRPVRSPECDPVPEGELGRLVEEASHREGITPDLLRAVIEQESAYLPCAISPKGARGLMQLMPGTAADLGVADPFDARQNVDGGARFLGQLLERYGGNLVLALAAYNAGPATVDAAGGVPLIPETAKYVSAILARLGDQGASSAAAPPAGR